MKYKVEYEVPPMRGINWTVVEAASVTQIRREWGQLHPRSRIRNISEMEEKEDG